VVKNDIITSLNTEQLEWKTVSRPRHECAIDHWGTIFSLKLRVNKKLSRREQDVSFGTCITDFDAYEIPNSRNDNAYVFNSSYSIALCIIVEISYSRVKCISC